MLELARLLPTTLRTHLAGATLHPITIGQSGHATYRVTRSNHPTLYLKISSQPNDSELQAEAARLEWLQGRLPVPAVEAFATTDASNYLLLSEIPGIMSCDPTLTPNLPAVIRALAEGMNMIHAIDTTNCPFDQTIDAQVARAQLRIQQGLIDPTDFDQRFQGRTPQQVLDFVITHRPTTENKVFTHGDYCLPNVILDPTTLHINGFIDLSRSGLADPYQDIALATRSLTHNFGPSHEHLLHEAFKLDNPDQQKLSFYKALDELF